MAVTVARRTRRRARPGAACWPTIASWACGSWRAPTRPAGAALAGPLVAAAVCLDVDRLRGARCDAARHARRLQAPHRGAPRGAVRGRDRVRARRSRCASCRRPRSTAAACTGRTCTRSAGRSARSTPSPTSASPTGFRSPGCARAAPRGGRRRRAQRRDRRGVDRRQGDARPVHATASPPRYPGFGFEQHVGYITPEHTPRGPGARPDAASPAVVRGDRLCAARSRPLSTAASPRRWPPCGCACAATASSAATCAWPAARSTWSRKRGPTLVVCEVKARRGARRGGAGRGRGPRQQRRLAEAAEVLLAARPGSRAAALRRDRRRRPSHHPHSGRVLSAIRARDRDGSAHRLLQTRAYAR